MRTLDRWPSAIDPPEGYLSSAEVMKQAGITPRQLEYWCQEGFIEGQAPFHGSGYRRLWTPEQVERVKAILTAYREATAILEAAGLPAGVFLRGNP